MKAITCGLAVLLLVGCTKLDESPAPSASSTANTSAPDGGASNAPVGTPGMQPFMPPQVDAVVQQPAAPQQSAPAPVQEAPRDDKGIIGKMTARIVDYHKVMQENPRLKVVENKAQGDDPLTFAASAYVSARSRASVLNFKHNLDIMKATNEGRNLSYDDLLKLMQQTGLQLTELYPYQMYAYDDQTGAILVLEDPDEKARRYKAAGIPLE